MIKISSQGTNILPTRLTFIRPKVLPMYQVRTFPEGGMDFLETASYSWGKINNDQKYHSYRASIS